MSQIIVAVSIIVGAVLTAICGFVCGSVIDRIENSTPGNRIFRLFATAGVMFLAGAVAYSCFGILAAVIAAVAAAAPGYFLFAWFLALLSETPGEKSWLEFFIPIANPGFYRAVFCLASAVVGALVSAVVCGHSSPMTGLTMAVVGAPIVAICASGLVVDLFIVLLVLSCIVLNRLGAFLEHQAERILSHLHPR